MPEPKKRVLLVDDEPQIGKIFTLKLQLAGFEVVSTTDGARAVELARTQEFDVMLLDILMPDITGFDVLESVRAFSSVPIIVFTARPEVFDMARSMGANDFIAKPLIPDALVQKIKSVLGMADQPG